MFLEFSFILRQYTLQAQSLGQKAWTVFPLSEVVKMKRVAQSHCNVGVDSMTSITPLYSYFPMLLAGFLAKPL
jgi:hypothetical protein